MKTDLRDNGIDDPQPPSTVGGKLRLVGPGLIVAATGVGAGDFIMAAIVGGDFGWALSWAIVVGAAIKLLLSEGIGRWFLATGKTFLQGWHSLGWWATGYFGIYVVLFGLIYGAAAPAVCGLVINAMFPSVPIGLGAVATAVVGFVLVWFGRYGLLEKSMTVLVGVMFVTVVGSALVILASLGSVDYTLVPSVPEGSFFRVLGVIGGVGGTITLTCYSYWIQEKGWRGRKWISMMRFDITTAYIITAIFAISVLIISAELLFGTGISFDGNEGLVTLADNYGERFGTFFEWMLLIGMFAAVLTSVIGPWHGVSFLFADFVSIVRTKGQGLDGSAQTPEKLPSFRIYLAWMTFPPMLLHLFEQPIVIVITYGVIGALFMPILAIGLLYLLNSRRVEREHRNGLTFNVLLSLIVALFIYLGGTELYQMVAG